MGNSKKVNTKNDKEENTKKERKVIARYIIEVFDDGDIEKKRLPLDQVSQENFINCNEISMATAQQLLVVREVIKSFDELDPDLSFEIKDEVRVAIRRVASDTEVNIVTVLNKVSRDLKCEDKNQRYEVNDLADMIDEYIKETYAASQFSNKKIDESECELFKTLDRSVPDRYKNASREAIKKFFKNPQIPFLLKNGKTIK